MKNLTNSTIRICHRFQGIKVWVNRCISNWNYRMRSIPKGSLISYRLRIWWVRVRLGLLLIACLALRKVWRYRRRSRRLRIYLARRGWSLLSSWKIHPKVVVGSRLFLRKLKCSRNLDLLKLTMQFYNHFLWVSLIIFGSDLPKLNHSWTGFFVYVNLGLFWFLKIGVSILFAMMRWWK